MALIDTVMVALYLVVGGLWTGSVLLLALAVLPTARARDIRTAAFESVVSQLTMWSRGASPVMFTTGSHLTGTYYAVDSLLGSGRGHLVLGMLAFWFVLTGLVEAGRVCAKDDLVEKEVCTPAKKTVPFYFGAALVAVLLLVDTGLLLN